MGGVCVQLTRHTRTYQGLVCIVLFWGPALRTRVVKRDIALKKRALYKRVPGIDQASTVGTPHKNIGGSARVVF